jgi:ubiquinone/menaquinone biosynthesis C-methylase UbiE
MQMARANWSVKEEIREYWSSRAATFDLSPGHEIFTDEERAAWHALFRKHLGEGGGRKALDLASGTGVIARLLHELGFRVTGLDFAELMLERARAKAADGSLPVEFVAGDAEQTFERDASYDVLVTRHLVWTLADPPAAFAEWLRILKPNGSLLIVDHDPTARSLRAKLQRRLAGLLRGRAKPAPMPGVDRAVHERIVAQVYFSGGTRPEAVAELLEQAGFEGIVVDRDLKAVHRGQGRRMPLHQRLERASHDRYAVCARKPDQSPPPAPKGTR